MALVLADRVQETSTTSGTGTLTLSGAVPGFTTFSSAIGNGNTTFYTIYDATAFAWEVGIGTVGSGTLSRDTVLSNSLGTTAKINLAGNSSSVFCTYPSEKSVNLDSSGNVSPLGTIASGTWQGTTIGVAYGGTGVTASSGANSVVLRDADQNITANSVTQNLTKVTSAGGTTTLTPASSHFQVLTGTSTQTFKLPDATSLPVGSAWIFDNDSTANLTVTDNANATVDVVAPGGYTTVVLEANGTVAGEWLRFGMIPAEVNWGTNSLDLGGSTVVTNGTWQGTPIAYNYGGTGLTTFTAANYALYSTSATALTAGTLPVLAGGTGVTTSTGTGSVVLSDAPTLTGAVTIGSTTGTDTLTFGRSTGAQTVNVATGASGTGVTKTVNIGTGGSSVSTSIITIGPTTGNATSTVNIGAQSRSGNTTTINMGTSATAGTTNITIGTSSGGTSNTTLNGTVTLQNALAVTSGGTGQTSYTDGQLLIGNTTGNTLTKSTLTAGSGISITNGNGSITIAATSTGATITNDTTTASNRYPLFADATSGTLSTAYTSNAKYLYKPSTGELTAPEVVASNGIVVNSKTVSTSYSIPSGSSAMSAGPITVASGVSVTVPSGSRWVVL